MWLSGHISAAQPGAEQGAVSILLLLDMSRDLGVSCYQLVQHSEGFPCDAYQKLAGFQLNREKKKNRESQPLPNTRTRRQAVSTSSIPELSDMQC